MSAYRKSIPLKVQLHAALYQLGLEPYEVDLDHSPALGLRPINPETGDTIPPANDPRCLIWRPKADHKAKTFGRNGESSLSITGNGDVSRIAKTKRLTRAQADFRARMLAKDAGELVPEQKRTSRKIPSRPFQKRTAK